MNYGFIIYTGGDIHNLAALAAEAEEAGWDGVFYWDGIYLDRHAEAGDHLYDPWVVLAAFAMRTERVRIGALLTPLPRRRPWKVARESVSVDHLSRGRLILPVGMGFLPDGGFSRVGEPSDARTRAERLDESLEIICGLWSGRPFAFHGSHYAVEEMTFLPPPVQAPRIPIWVPGIWPRRRSMQRVLRYDGLLPEKRSPEGSPAQVTPEDIRVMRDYIAERRESASRFDVVWEGETPGDDPRRALEVVRPYAAAGVTWWMESRWAAIGPAGLPVVRERIRQGPPPPL